MAEPVRVGSYSGQTREETLLSFAADAAQLAALGYLATNQIWDGEKLLVTYQLQNSDDRLGNTPVRTELCEVRLEKVPSGLFGKAYRFVAEASGPQGLREVDSTRAMKHAFLDSQFESEMVALRNRMLTNGWEALPDAFTSGGGRLPRFQRRV